MDSPLRLLTPPTTPHAVIDTTPRPPVAGNAHGLGWRAMSTDLESAGAAATVAVASPEWRRNPWWIPPFLGRVPNIEKRLVDLLGFVALALLFENYDFSLLNAALKHIAHDLNIAETDLGYFTSLVRLGALPAFLII